MLTEVHLVDFDEIGDHSADVPVESQGLESRRDEGGTGLSAGEN
jgi:hypothetical protein